MNSTGYAREAGTVRESGILRISAFCFELVERAKGAIFGDEAEILSPIWRAVRQSKSRATAHKWRQLTVSRCETRSEEALRGARAYGKRS